MIIDTTQTKIEQYSSLEERVFRTVSVRLHGKFDHFERGYEPLMIHISPDVLKEHFSNWTFIDHFPEDRLWVGKPPLERVRHLHEYGFREHGMSGRPPSHFDVYLAFPTSAVLLESPYQTGGFDTDRYSCSMANALAGFYRYPIRLSTLTDLMEKSRGWILDFVESYKQCERCLMIWESCRFEKCYLCSGVVRKVNRRGE